MKNRPRLTIGTTPCPNDSYLLGAVATGQTCLPGVDLALELADIETLNERVLARNIAVAKISCAIYHEIADDYALLDTGAALADGYGPLVLAREPLGPGALVTARIAAPGRHTTGALLFRHWAPRCGEPTWMSYDRIIGALLDGACDVGVCIHESRFTYAEAGLHCLVDLGSWWQASRGLPVALGCYVMRRRLYERYGGALEQLMRRSLRIAELGDARVTAYIRTHAQELDDRVTHEHIALYVNRHTWSLGEHGRAAIAALSSPHAACAAVGA